MKKAIIVIIGLVIATQVAFAFSEVLTYLKGRTDNEGIVLDWQSGSETGVKTYTVERSDIKTDNFTDLSDIPATGNNSTYHYRDANFNSIQQANASHNTPLSDLYKYRLKINYDGAISYSQTITVTSPSASVKRTWGMIKEMFR